MNRIATHKWLAISLSFIIWHLSFCHAVAQTLTANAQQQVAVNQQFRLTFTANSQDVSNFRLGQMPDALEILIGPTTSTQSSYSWVNGQTSQTSSTTYTYILRATKEGSFTIPAASATIDGKQVSSASLKIKVAGQAQGGNNGGTNNSQGTAEVRPTGTAISGSDLFIKVSASKRKVVEQEPVLLTYKVYTLVNLTQLEGKMPDLNGFHSQEIPLPQEKSFKVEQFNGRNYNTVTWSQYVMFPQMTGRLEIPSIMFTGTVMQRNRYVDPFEAFFNGGSGYEEVRKQIKAPGVEIEVEPLPKRPDGFSGGVGHLSMTAEIDKTDVKANDPFTIKVTVSGTGNLQLLKEPQVQFPADFDTYDVKRTENTRLTANGHEGSVVFEYLAVPRHQGQYDIPPVDFIYFDTQEHAYKTISSEAFHLTVAKGEGSDSNIHQYTGQEDVEMLANDIRFIKTGDTTLRQTDELFFLSQWYWIAFGTLLLVFISLFLIFRKRAIENADLVKARGKKANKVATKRLKQAARLMKENKPGQFFDEVLRALWGYVGDKLNMPVEQLSRENIADKLQLHNVSSDTIAEFIAAIDECEFERYAPGDPKGNMSKVYEKAMTAIEQIEDNMKRKTKKAAALAVVLMLTCMLPMTAEAVTKADADSAYVNEDYQTAIAGYEALLQQGVSADLYYNLGNAYYRIDDITHAIIAYERALLLSPGDADIRFNLQMAQSKTVDKIVPESEMFFVTWYHSLINLTNVDGWAYAALMTLALAIILLLIYLFAGSVGFRKIGFFGGIIAIVAFILFNVFAWQQRQRFLHRDGAVIIQSAVSVKSTPAQGGTDLFILHEGTKVTITDETMSDWKEIRVPDGKQGWLKTEQIEVI